MPAPLLTREIFGNIPAWAQWTFYLAAAAAVAAWGYGIWRRVQRWRIGRRTGAAVDWRLSVERLLRDVLLQRRMWRTSWRAWASSAHVLLFSGFIVLLIGTTLIAIEHVLADLLGRAPTNPLFHKGVYYGVYEVVMDAFGLALLAGCTMFLVRRLRGDGSFAKTPVDVGVLVALIAIGVTGYLVEGLRIIHAQTPLPGLSPVGLVVARLFGAIGVDVECAGRWHFFLWWLHAALALGFIALMPYTRLLHSLAGTVNLAIRDHRIGVMSPVSLAEVEETGEIGVSRLTDFSFHQLLELDACVSCGRCQDACPAFEAGKPLSPRDLVQDLVGVLDAADGARSLHGEVIGAETLWSCTTCGACADVCPLGVSPLRMITDMRRHLIGEGALRGSPATALQKTERTGNPWGLAANDRMAWAAGLDIPLASANADFEVLYWVGCAAAYDKRVQKIARSTARLLQAAGVNFAVLGPEERCTGETARRMGDELLFQQLAEQNVATLAKRKATRIVAHCPHCVNSLRNDYAQLGAQYEVVHHSQLLAELAAAGRLPSPPAHSPQPTAHSSSITYHDPCYLARAAGETAAPRDVLAAAHGAGGEDALPPAHRPPPTAPSLVELPRTGRETACCGAGGGRMWFDDPAGRRIGQGRVQEIAATGAATVAVACPFCLIMLTDGLAAAKPDMQVRDIAEVLAEATLGGE